MAIHEDFTIYHIDALKGIRFTRASNWMNYPAGIKYCKKANTVLASPEEAWFFRIDADGDDCADSANFTRMHALYFRKESDIQNDFRMALVNARDERVNLALGMTDTEWDQFDKTGRWTLQKNNNIVDLVMRHASESKLPLVEVPRRNPMMILMKRRQSDHKFTIVRSILGQAADPTAEYLMSKGYEQIYVHTLDCAWLGENLKDDSVEIRSVYLGGPGHDQCHIYIDDRFGDGGLARGRNL